MLKCISLLPNLDVSGWLMWIILSINALYLQDRVDLVRNWYAGSFWYHEYTKSVLNWGIYYTIYQIFSEIWKCLLGKFCSNTFLFLNLDHLHDIASYCSPLYLTWWWNSSYKSQWQHFEYNCGNLNKPKAEMFNNFENFLFKIAWFASVGLIVAHSG